MLCRHFASGNRCKQLHLKLMTCCISLLECSQSVVMHLQMTWTCGWWDYFIIGSSTPASSMPWDWWSDGTSIGMFNLVFRNVGAFVFVEKVSQWIRSLMNISIEHIFHMSQSFGTLACGLMSCWHGANRFMSLSSKLWHAFDCFGA